MTQDYSGSNLQSKQKEITTIDQLARALAEQTRLISNNIISGIRDKSMEYKPIIDFSHSVKKHLIHDLSAEEFADLYAQTITFGLFTAVIMAKGNRKCPRQDLLKTIPNTNIVLHELFEYLSGNSIPSQLGFNINRIIAVLRTIKSGKLLDDYIKKRNQDPLIHFYETFLSKYNPNLREKRGVYYTPRPVVSFIVKSIHLLLQEKFLIAGGLANNMELVSGSREKGKEEKKKKNCQWSMVLIVKLAAKTREDFVVKNNLTFTNGKWQMVNGQ